MSKFSPVPASMCRWPSRQALLLLGLDFLIVETRAGLVDVNEFVDLTGVQGIDTIPEY